MVLIRSNAYPEDNGQVRKSSMCSAKVAFIERLIGVGSVARGVAFAPYLASAALRVVSGLALGFGLVQMVKMNIG